jgi:hypothetical protein
MLDRKPSLRHDAAYFLDPAPWAAYFEDSIVDNEQPRYADQYEALHIARLCPADGKTYGRVGLNVP